MKKHFLTLALAAITLGFTACEDVPAPYEINGSGGEQQSETLIDESFAQTLGSFSAINTVGSYSWKVSYGSAQVTSYVDSDGDGVKDNNAAESWLISPTISLNGVETAHISFDYILRYANASELKDFYQLLISKDYNGLPANATWTALDYNQVQVNDWDTWTSSGNINVPAEYLGQEKVTFALRYKADKKAATWEVKNFLVKQGAGDYTPGGGQEQGVRTLPYAEEFSTTLGGFKNYTTSGSGEWTIDYSTAKATGYDNSTKVTTAGTYYLVSPEISLSGVTEAHVAYEYILRYNKADDNQQVFITTNFDESHPAEGWTLLNGKHTEGADWTTFSKADIAVPAEYMGKTIRLAFRYNTNNVSGSTWEVKNFSISAGKPGESGGDQGGDAGDDKAANGNFENWSNGKPNKWKTASSAGNATLSQSTEAHSGKYAVEVTGSNSANKRLGYEETTLPAGTYTVKFYAKAASATGGSVRPGYVPVDESNKVGSYVYAENYTNGLTQGEWQEVTYTFTLDAETRLSLVIMVSKNPGGSVLIDDFTLTDGTGKVLIK